MIYATLNANGTPKGFYRLGVHRGDQIPAGAVEISEATWRECLENPGLRRIVNGGAVAFAPPVVPVAPARAITYKADIWRRATDPEAEIIVAVLSARPVRRQRLFNDATHIDHADADFPELLAGFTQAFGAARATTLLAPSA